MKTLKVTEEVWYAVKTQSVKEKISMRAFTEKALLASITLKGE